MLDKLNDYLNRHQWVAMLIILGICTLMFLGVASVILDSSEKLKKRKDYLMRECKKDRKEWECEALLKDKQNFDIIMQGF